jgi:hypothetical protein
MSERSAIYVWVRWWYIIENSQKASFSLKKKTQLFYSIPSILVKGKKLHFRLEFKDSLEEEKIGVIEF